MHNATLNITMFDILNEKLYENNQLLTAQYNFSFKTFVIMLIFIGVVFMISFHAFLTSVDYKIRNMKIKIPQVSINGVLQEQQYLRIV